MNQTSTLTGQCVAEFLGTGLLIFFNAPFSGTAPVFCFPVYGKMRFVVNDEIRPGTGIPAGILKFL